MDISYLVLGLALFLTGCSLLGRFSRRHDSREPPLIAPGIPVIGHVIGFLRLGVPYYVQEWRKHPLPAFTLDLVWTKVYIINSPALVAAAQRAHKNISFDPFLTSTNDRMSGIQGKGLDILREERTGGAGVNTKVIHAMQPALLGPGLDKMNQRMISFLKTSVDSLVHQQDTPFDLYEWCRHAITVASTDAVYGPLNPYKSNEVERLFWDFESNLALLILKVLPSLIARKAWRARETLVQSFIKYYETNGHEDSSSLAYGRWKAQHDAGATTEDIARLEVSNGIGILANTVPFSFWTVFEICSRPSLLDELRQEIRQNALHITQDNLHIVDLADIRDKCQLLVSTFQEILRVKSTTAVTRFVYEDMMLNDQYLIKGGSILQMLMQSINRDNGMWGDKSEDFDPWRFTKKGAERPTGFMSFGTSPHVCPGRHFASGEILSLVAMLILRFDITPAAGSWTCPKFNPKALAASVPPLAEPFMVKVTARAEFEGTEWAFNVTEGKGRFGLITG